MKKLMLVVLCMVIGINGFAVALAADEETARLQIRLKQYGYYTMKIDGDYGNGTKRAVSEFQTENGLEATGEADEQTKKLLYEGKPISKIPDFLLRDEITWGMSADEVDAAMGKESIEPHKEIGIFPRIIEYKRVPVSKYKAVMYGWMLGECGIQALIYKFPEDSGLKNLVDGESSLLEKYDDLKSLLEYKYGKPATESSEWTDESYSWIYQEEAGAVKGVYTRLCTWDLDGVEVNLALNSDLKNFELEDDPIIWIGYFNSFLMDIIDELNEDNSDEVNGALISCFDIEFEEPDVGGL